MASVVDQLTKALEEKKSIKASVQVKRNELLDQADKEDVTLRLIDQSIIEIEKAINVLIKAGIK